MQIREVVQLGLLATWRLLQITVVIPASIIGVVLLGAVLDGISPIQEAVIGIHHWAETTVRPAPVGTVLVLKCTEESPSPFCEKPTMVPIPIAEAAHGASNSVKNIYWVLVLISAGLVMATYPITGFSTVYRRMVGGMRRDKDDPAAENNECPELSPVPSGVGPLSTYAKLVHEGMNESLFAEILRAFEAEATAAGYSFVKNGEHCLIDSELKRRLGLAAYKARVRAISLQLSEYRNERLAVDSECEGGDASRWAEEIIETLRMHGVSMVQMNAEVSQETGNPNPGL